MDYNLDKLYEKICENPTPAMRDRKARRAGAKSVDNLDLSTLNSYLCLNLRKVALDRTGLVRRAGCAVSHMRAASGIISIGAGQSSAGRLVS